LLTLRAVTKIVLYLAGPLFLASRQFFDLMTVGKGSHLVNGYGIEFI
jgi:hypothetical protein